MEANEITHRLSKTAWRGFLDLPNDTTIHSSYSEKEKNRFNLTIADKTFRVEVSELRE